MSDLATWMKPGIWTGCMYIRTISGKALLRQFATRWRNCPRLQALLPTHPSRQDRSLNSGDIRVMNVKCDTRLIGSFREEKGILPAYHMSKARWLTVALDGTVEEDKIKFLLDMRYDLTKGCRK